MPSPAIQGSSPVSIDPLARWAEEQQWITAPAQDAVQEGVRLAFNIFGGNAKIVRSLLHGDWLHEPLHAIMTDVPVGSWTAAVLFDGIAAVTGSEKLDTAADALVLLGLAGAAGAAVTGMNDWAEVKQEAPRRVGSMHALINIASTVIFAASAIARRKGGSRGTARALGAVGLVVNAAAAHLGGDMIYEHGIGVTRGGKRWQD